ncbi:MAG TPA: S8 family serine peptidase [Chthoniobacterales bacterium]
MHTKRRNYRILTLAASLAVTLLPRLEAEPAFVPNDPYFAPDSDDWYGQWHLVDQAFGGNMDVNVQDAWNNGITGKGVTIGFVGGGFETTHPDLAPNYVAADSWDFAGNDSVPDPVDDNAGTAEAGIAAARGGNGIGVTGVAPYASIAGLRIDSTRSADFVEGVLYHSSGSNTSIDIKVLSYPIPYGSPTFVSISAEQKAALKESAEAGTIHVVGAGDSRQAPPREWANWGDSNKQDLLNESSVIAVASFASYGGHAVHSSYGNNVFVTAPSSADGDRYGYFGDHGVGISSTDRVGPNGYGWLDPYGGSTDFRPDYTNALNGSAAAAPLVAGVLALTKEVQPNLDTRFAKHLLVRTSTKVDTQFGDWQSNAAGNHFNPSYGFGLINASKLVSVATEYAGVTPLITETTEGVVNQDIPGLVNDSMPASAEFTLTTTAAPIEDILVTLTIDHKFVENIEAYLTSPSGTRTRLMINGSTLGGSIGTQPVEWTLLANAFWGENGAGTWKLELRDLNSDFYYGDNTPYIGQWLSFGVEAHFGELIAVPEPRTEMLLAASGIVFLMRRRVYAARSKSAF